MNRRFLPLIIGSLLLPLGCGGDPTGPFPTLVATTTSLPNGAPSVAYSETLTATGGDGSYTWSLTVGSLPTGLSLNTSTGDITGTPTGSSSTFTVQVESGDGQSNTQALVILVNSPLAVTTTSLPDGLENVDYGTATLTATGADGGNAWSVLVGSLPTGLSLAASGDITGTPTVAETGSFTVQVASGDGQTAQQALSITVITGGGPPVMTTSVNVVDFAFTPPNIQVSAGATVTWTWTGNALHNVTFGSSSIANSLTQTSGTYQVAMPTAAGVYTYQCTIHAGMNGSVTVP